MFAVLRRNRGFLLTGAVAIVTAVAADYLHFADWIARNL